MNLLQILTDRGIFVGGWYHELGTKTVADLQSEIDHGESRLTEVAGKLVRTLRVVGIWIYVDLGKQRFVLVEDKQIFFTGAMRQRDLQQLTEKIQPGESPEVAARRLLLEELSFEYLGELIDRGQETRNMISDSYPGLQSCYEMFNYEISLTVADLPNLKFAEVQSQKLSLFTLKPL
jgi:hypothetical protein